MHFCFISACMDGSYYLTLNKAVKVNLCYGGMSTAAYCSLPISAINFFLRVLPNAIFVTEIKINLYILYAISHALCLSVIFIHFLNVRIYLQP